MKLIHRMVLKALPGPFLASFGSLMFLLLMQFLMRYLPDLVGKGLPFFAIVELIAYNLAYMVVLAVPMSVLIATLMAFGRLAESQAYVVVKNAGISLPQLVWPVLVASGLVMGMMLYFNNIVLPESNFRARNLWNDIRRKKPGFALEPGVFYTGLRGYSIRAQEVPASGDDLRDVTIFEHGERDLQQTTITARRGRLETRPGGNVVDLVLQQGEVHRLKEASVEEATRRYERLAFDRYRLRFDLSDFAFERSDPTTGSRSDRTMPTAHMVALVDSLEATIGDQQAELRSLMLTREAVPRQPMVDMLSPPDLAAPDSSAPPGSSRTPGALAAPSPDFLAPATALADPTADPYERALQAARSVRQEIESRKNEMEWETQRADRYRVEIHKKYSIAFACIIFVLVGVPLGLSVRRGGLGVVAALSVGIFLFYWVTLVQGEKFADRGYLPPWLGMWAANLVIGCIGLWLSVYVALDFSTRRPVLLGLLRDRLRGRE